MSWEEWKEALRILSEPTRREEVELLREFIELSKPILQGVGHTPEEAMRLMVAVSAAEIVVENG